MAKYRYVYTNFWEDPKVMENFTPEDKYFYLYLLTNPRTTQIGVYKLPKKMMAFELGYANESIRSLLDRFSNYHKLIKYNDETCEIAIKNWGKFNLTNAGKPVLDLIKSELVVVEDISLLQFVAEGISNEVIKSLFANYIAAKIPITNNEPDKVILGMQENNDTYDGACDNTSTPRGQNKNENKNKNENINNNYMRPNEQKIDTGDEQEELPLSDDESSDGIDSKVPYDKIINLFNRSCKSLPKVRARSKQRDKMIKALWKRIGEDSKKLQQYFILVEKSDFLTGRTGVWMNCNFDWLLKESNYIKVLEGNYTNKTGPFHPPGKKDSWSMEGNRTYLENNDIDKLERKLLGWDS